jgi:hypothetical protein
MIVTETSYLSTVVDYHGLGCHLLLPPRFLVRPRLNASTLGRRKTASQLGRRYRTRY